jgi:hypothetical protein
MEEVSFSHSFHIRVYIKKFRVISTFYFWILRSGTCMEPEELAFTFALPRDIVIALNVTWKTAKKNTKICSWCSPSAETSDTIP